MRRRYTPKEISFIREIIAGRSHVEAAELFNERFSPPITVRRMKDLCQRHGLRNGYPKKTVGDESTDRHGYTKTKTADGTWKRKHFLIWEKANGKVPKGHAVIFADGNKQNMALDNLLMVSRQELGLMNINKFCSTNPDRTRLGHAVVKARMALSKHARKKLGMRLGTFEAGERRKLERKERNAMSAGNSDRGGE